MRVRIGPGRLSVLLAASVAMVAGCSSSGGSRSHAAGSPGSTSNGASSSGAASSNQSSKTLNVVLAGLPAHGGDPFQAVAAPRWEVTGAVFDALTTVNSQGPQPWLATSWTQVSPTAWNFTLRQGVNFSNGEPFNAQSVVTAVDALQTPAEKGSVANLYLSGIKGASVVSDNVVQITTTAPDGILPQQVSVLVPVPTQYWNKVGPTGFATAPVGTGPYEVQSLSDTKWVLKANPTSWQHANIGTIVFTALSDFAARGNAVTSGQAQIDLESTVSQVSTFKSDGLDTHVIADTGVLVLQFINKGTPSPIDNQQVRQALNYAINRPQFLKVLYNNVTQAASQGTTPGMIGYDPSVQPYPYDPAKAKQLLAQAGYPNGFSFTAVVTVGAFPEDQQLFEVVQNDLKAVGVTMTLDTVNEEQAVTYLLSGKYPGQVFSTAYQSAPELDATKSYSTYSCLRPTGVYCDPVAAKFLSDAITEPNGQARTATLNSLAQEESTNPAAMWLVNNFYITATAKSVHNYTENLADYVDWNKITMG